MINVVFRHQSSRSYRQRQRLSDIVELPLSIIITAISQYSFARRAAKKINGNFRFLFLFCNLALALTSAVFGALLRFHGDKAMFDVSETISVSDSAFEEYFEF